jgi:excisionase family DNA binding protein
MENEFLTITEVAKYLKIPKSTIYKLSQKGKLPSCKIGKQLRFKKSVIDKLITEERLPERLAQDKKGRNNYDILLVDDDKIVLKSISKFLSSHGYNIEIATNGEEALKKVKEDDFDLLITDIRMPGINGIETIKKIREFLLKKKKPFVPEVVITGYADAAVEREAEKLGISDYIYKPFATTEFINTIEKKLKATG